MKISNSDGAHSNARNKSTCINGKQSAKANIHPRPMDDMGIAKLEKIKDETIHTAF
jgi:hypothetical protein